MSRTIVARDWLNPMVDERSAEPRLQRPNTSRVAINSCDCLSLQRKSGTKLARRYVSVADLKAALAFESSVSFSRPPLDTRRGQRK
jgi:hypothetical protein